MVDSQDEDHYINGSNSVLISCTNLQGINVTEYKFQMQKTLQFMMTIGVYATVKMIS